MVGSAALGNARALETTCVFETAYVYAAVTYLANPHDHGAIHCRPGEGGMHVGDSAPVNAADAQCHALRRHVGDGADAGGEGVSYRRQVAAHEGEGPAALFCDAVHQHRVMAGTKAKRVHAGTK